jgi:hypothetical protein
VWEGSVERSCEPMNKNWIEGAAEQGERAKFREALVIKRGGVDPAVVQGRSAFLPGEISPRARKGDGVEPEREVSSGHSSRGNPAKGQTRRSVQGHGDAKGKASDACASGAGGRYTR